MIAVLDEFKSTVVSALQQGKGLTLAWTIGELGFPAERAPLKATGTFARSRSTSAALQAGMLARMVVLARAAGAARVHWHTTMSKIVSMADYPTGVYEDWISFSTMGLRVDTSADDGSAPFRSWLHAFRRPSWFTFRALSVLLRETTSAQVVHMELNRLVVQLDLHTTALGARRAFLVWIDQTASETWRTFRFELSGAGWQLLSLVPGVSAPRWGTTWSDSFPLGEAVDWTLDASSTATAALTEEGEDELVLQLLMEPADAAGNAAPALLIAEGEFLSAGLETGGADTYAITEARFRGAS